MLTCQRQKIPVFITNGKMSIKGRVYGNSYDIIGISVRHEFCEDADTKTGFDHGHDGVIIVESVGDMGFDSLFLKGFHWFTVVSFFKKDKGVLKEALQGNRFFLCPAVATGEHR